LVASLHIYSDTRAHHATESASDTKSIFCPVFISVTAPDGVPEPVADGVPERFSVLAADARTIEAADGGSLTAADICAV
jgi:hypothetical protein